MSIIQSFLKQKKSLSSGVCRGEAFLVNQKNSNKIVELDSSGKAKVLKVLSDREVSDLKRMNLLEQFPRSAVSFKDSQCDLIPEKNFSKLCKLLKLESANGLKQRRDSRLGN